MERLKSYLKHLPDESTRERFAVECGTTLGHMRNCLYGQKQLGPVTCVLVERVTGSEVRRWEMRPDDWHRIWPELIGSEGAPAVPQVEQSA